MYHVRVKPSALKAMLEHGKSQLDSGLEVGGVITGKKENSSVMVTHAIPLSIGQKTTVEITPEHFAEAYRKKEESGIEDPIIGWYHSHPGYSCFMSGTDENAHRRMLNLYKDAIALVLDPVMYSNEKPSREYFKVFTLSNGRVTEIPSDIDGSQASKDEMFRGYVSGKETVTERIIIKPPEGRSWAQIASVALLALILVMALIGQAKLGEIGMDLTLLESINRTVGNMDHTLENAEKELFSIESRIKALEGEFGDITNRLGTIEEMVKNYDFEVTIKSKPAPFFLRESTKFTIEVRNIGNCENTYSVEVPSYIIASPVNFPLKAKGEEIVTLSITEEFVPSQLKTPVLIKVIDSQEESKKLSVTLEIKPRITFKISETLDPEFKENKFLYSHELKLGETEYTIEVEGESGSKFSIKYSFQSTEEENPEISLTMDDKPLEYDVFLPGEFPSTGKVTLIIAPTTIPAGSTFIITVKDTQSGEEYILELSFFQIEDAC